MEIQTYLVAGMTCGHCQQAVTSELSKIAGVADVRVDLSSGTATVTSERPLALSDVAGAIEEAGYELVS